MPTELDLLAMPIAACGDVRPIPLRLAGNVCGVAMAASPPRLQSADDPANAFVVERLGSGSLLVFTGREPVRQSAAPAPPVMVLTAGAVFVAGGFRFEVVRRSSGAAAVADGRSAERRCAVCRGPIAAGGAVWACACGTLMHFATAAADADALACAGAAGACPRCSSPVAVEVQR